MNGILSFTRIERRHQHLVDGKALALATLMRSGIAVPNGLCITTSVYGDFVRTTDLSTRIGLELGRLPLAEMRWEEIWDTALRSAIFFSKPPSPDRIKETLCPELETRFAGYAVAVRSSSPQEGRTGASFAGLHESYVNVRGLDAILEHIRLVWASLWSDGALTPAQVVKILSNPANISAIAKAQETIDESVQHQGRPGLTPETVVTAEGDFVMRARQIISQPAGQGVAVGTARVISEAVWLKTNQLSCT